MKLTNVSLLTAAAVATANAAVVTVTQHVHENAIVSVQGLVYVENGQTYTTYSTASGAAGNSADAASSTVIAIAGAAVTPVSENVVSSSQVSTAATPSTAAATTAAATEQTSAATEQTSAATSEQSSAAATTVAATAQSSTPTTTLSPSTSSAIAATSSTASASTSSTSGLSDFASTILNEHNVKRALHEDTPALSWSDTLATYAQNYANNYDCSGTLTHSGGPYGENLALGYDAAGAVDAWYNEISEYNWSDPGYSSSTGHFTQVVWKSTTELGCGIKACGGAWGSYVICSYNPAGNYIGEFAENVEPLA